MFSCVAILIRFLKLYILVCNKGQFPTENDINICKDLVFGRLSEEEQPRNEMKMKS